MSLLPTCWNIASKLVQADMTTVIMKSNCSIRHRNPASRRNNHNIISPMVNIICSRPCNDGALPSGVLNSQKGSFPSTEALGCRLHYCQHRVTRNMNSTATTRTKSYFEKAHSPLQRVLTSFIKLPPFFGAHCLPILKWMSYILSWLLAG